MGSETVLPRSFSVLRVAFAASLSISAALYFVWTWHWPLVGDASLIHYIAFLIERGWAPYRDLGDMNMPGSFLIELAAMHLFGPGALAWRLFDFTLLAAATASFFVLAGRRNRFAALFAASLFILIHGRDGLAQGGQRDLTMAACLLASTAFLFLAVRRNLPWASALFGLLAGVAVTIKPTAVLLSVTHLLFAVHVLRTRRRPWIAHAAAATLAGLIVPAIALGFLLREHALAAFLAGFHGIVPYYASLGHRPLGYILLHSVSPILSLVLLWLAVLVLRKPMPTPTSFSHYWERNALLAGVLFGILNCIVQARALPYYRYPLLAFLLPLMALDFCAAAAILFNQPEPQTDLRRGAVTILATAALAVGSLFLAPQSAILLHRYRWYETDFISSLTQNLTALGGPALSHHIQCIDSVSGCGTVLYNMRLEPATGVLSDFLLFGPPEIPVIAQTRHDFLQAILTDSPQVIVVTSHLHIDGPDHYRKLDLWPAFASLLAADYILATDWTPTRTNRWWSREELPAGYRLYVHRAFPPEGAKASYPNP